MNRFHNVYNVPLLLDDSITAIDINTLVVPSVTEVTIPFEEATTIPAKGITVDAGVFTFSREGIYTGSLSLNISSTLSATLHIWLERERLGVWEVIPSTLSTLHRVTDAVAGVALSGTVAFLAEDKLRVRCIKTNAGNLTFVNTSITTVLGVVGALPCVISISRVR